MAGVRNITSAVIICILVFHGAVAESNYGEENSLFESLRSLLSEGYDESMTVTNEAIGTMQSNNNLQISDHPKVARSNPPKATRSNPPKETRSNPPKYARSNPPKVARSNPPKVARSNPPKFARSSPPKFALSDPPKVARSDPPKVTLSSDQNEASEDNGLSPIVVSLLKWLISNPPKQSRDARADHVITVHSRTENLPWDDTCARGYKHCGGYYPSCCEGFVCLKPLTDWDRRNGFKRCWPDYFQESDEDNTTSD